MLLAQFIREGAAALGTLYPPQEARSLVLRLCSERLGTESYTHIVEPGFEIPAGSLDGIQEDLRRLSGGEPLQYILGYQEFCGRRFRVGPGVLIPRPETEELVRAALEKLPSEGSALDLCTGSGCIAWTLALDRPGARVTAVDISPEALMIASRQFREGGREGGAPGTSLRSSLPLRGPLPSLRDNISPCCPPGDICPEGWPRAAMVSRGTPSPGPTFVQRDILQVPEEFEGAPFDVLTANPPYIRESERAQMHTNVLQHEPELALFVPDADPLLFYRAIARWAQRFLRPGGFGIVEINEELGADTAGVFAAAGLKDVALASDFRGKERFVTFYK